MKRTRTINAAPERPASGTVETITKVITDSLAAAKNLSKPDVEAALRAAAPALLILVSGRHLNRAPVVLVAGETICEFYCRYDMEAIGGEENLNAVPGMPTAETFKIHLPAPEALKATITTIAASHPALSTEPAPTAVKATKQAVAAVPGSALDLAALEEML